MNNFLITGGAGFIGSTLTEQLLNRGDKVVAIDNFDPYYDPKLKEENVKPFLNNQNYKLERVDILDLDKLVQIFQDNKIDHVVHLAAKAGVRPSLEDPIAYQKVNGEGTLNILEAARRSGCKKLCLASSSSVYGNNKVVPFKETDVVDFAISPYAATKKANEVMSFDCDVLMAYGIDEIADMEIGFEMTDDDYDSTYSGPRPLKTSAADTHDYTADHYQESIASPGALNAYGYEVAYFGQDAAYDSNGVTLRSSSILKSENGGAALLLGLGSLLFFKSCAPR